MSVKAQFLAAILAAIITVIVAGAINNRLQQSKASVLRLDENTWRI